MHVLSQRVVQLAQVQTLLTLKQLE